MTFRCQNGGVELGALLPKALCRLMAIRRQSPPVRPRECPGDAPPAALISSSNAASDHHPSHLSLGWDGDMTAAEVRTERPRRNTAAVRMATSGKRCVTARLVCNQRDTAECSGSSRSQLGVLISLCGKSVTSR